MADLYDYFFGHILALHGPPWRLSIFNPESLRFEDVAGSGGGGSPLILPGDPPDFVITEDGDLIMVEGSSG